MLLTSYWPDSLNLISKYEPKIKLNLWFLFTLKRLDLLVGETLGRC